MHASRQQPETSWRDVGPDFLLLYACCIISEEGECSTQHPTRPVGYVVWPRQGMFVCSSALFSTGAPIVYPVYLSASIRRLQLVQNRSLRLITGCHTAAAIDHLHSETEILPVEAHLHLLSAQYLARALQLGHTSHAVVTLPSGPRRKKETSIQVLGSC